MSHSLHKQVIQGAIHILSDKNRWCKSRLAVNFLGFSCSPYSRFAKRFCAQGALERSAFQLLGDASSARELVSKIFDNGRSVSIVQIVNDWQGREAAIDLLRENL